MVVRKSLRGTEGNSPLFDPSDVGGNIKKVPVFPGFRHRVHIFENKDKTFSFIGNIDNRQGRADIGSETGVSDGNFPVVYKRAFDFHRRIYFLEEASNFDITMSTENSCF